MIDLLNKNIEGIKKEYIDGKINIVIDKSFEDSLLLNTSDKNEVNIFIEDEINVKILEKNIASCTLNYYLKPYSTLKHNLISLDKNQDSIRNIYVEKGAFWHAIYVELSQNNLNDKILCILKDEYAKGEILLSTLCKNDNKKVFDVNFLHEAKKTSSNMNNYGVVQDNASLYFVGIGHIKNGSKVSTAHQNARIMVFDKKCKAAASPILKIDENDVEASHSASVGKVNEEHLFYLMSRGINENDAKRLITLGYLNPVLPFIFDEATRNDVEQSILKRL